MDLTYPNLLRPPLRILHPKLVTTVPPGQVGVTEGSKLSIIHDL